MIQPATWKMLAQTPPVLRTLVQLTRILPQGGPMPEATNADAQLSAHLRETQGLVAQGLYGMAALEHREFFRRLGASVDKSAPRIILDRFAHRPQHSLELLHSAALLQEFEWKEQRGEQERYPMSQALRASREMIAATQAALQRVKDKEVRSNFVPVLTLARAYVEMRLLGLSDDRWDQLGKGVTNWADEVARLKRQLSLGSSSPLPLPKGVSARSEELSYVADLLSLELFLHDFLRSPAEYLAKRIQNRLGVLGDIHRHHKQRAEVLAEEYRRAAVALAVHGQRRVAYEIASELKTAEPYGRLEPALDVLNPETYAPYAEVHPLLLRKDAAAHVVPTMLASEAARPRLFVAAVRSLTAGNDRGLNQEALGRLRWYLSAARTPVAYVSDRSLFEVWEAVHRHALPIPSYVIADVGMRVFRNDAGEWRESLHWQQRRGANVLPGRDDKADALRFVAGREGLAVDDVVFAGDSVRDLAVFASGVQAIDAGADAPAEAILAGLARLGYLR